ncbi:hypothetical protein Ndes2526B_g04468 [Nannochloris sp. 'desiccata']
MVVIPRNLLLLAFLSLALHAVVHTGAAPTSWGLASLCLWGAVFTLRGWHRMDIWEQRLLMWAMFSIGSFAHFLKADPEFTGWSSVYYFCGPKYEYCTSTFRWNLPGWRKAIVLWNFCLSTALAFQRLAIEYGLGGLLPGEEAIARESFISIAWRLIPFWLNHWESNFGAECSSILFELPHFALELLVVLPLVQIIAGRLRVVGHPHLRADDPPQEQQHEHRINGQVRHRNNNNEPPVALAPDVLRCAWINDSSQLMLFPRLRAHKRTMAVIACITTVAAFNALVVPLAIERQAYIAPRSQAIFEYEAEISAIVSAGAAADRTMLYLEKEFRNAAKNNNDVDGNSTTSSTVTSPQYDIDKLLTLVPCVAAHNCTGPLSTEILAALQHRQKSGAWLGETLSSYFASYLSSFGEEDGVESAHRDREYAGPLLVPTHWAIRLLYVLNENAGKQPKTAALKGKEVFNRKESNDELLQIDPLRLATIIFDLKPAANSSSDSNISGNGVEEQNDKYQSSSLLQTGMDALDSVWAAASAATLGGYQKLDMFSKRSPTEFENMREAYLNKISAAAAKAGAASPPSPALVLPRLYRTMHKHVMEMRRMKDEDHRALVPLVESALAIMRLSCERWFALIGVYLGYLLFRDPPPAARALIRFVARVSRIFQRAILLSFPAVCWVYGAGLVFSSFASVIFWAGPVLRGLEHLRSATASVAPKEWHDATPDEFERMGGLCAICWGDLGTTDSSSGNGSGSHGAGVNGTATETPEGRNEAPDASEAASVHHIRAAGLPCGHAYHRKCIVGWLQSCYGQGRTPTCPMCQTEVPVRIKYRLPLTMNAIEVEQAEADGEGAGAGGINGAADGGGGGGGPHRREPGIPGLDMLVDELSEEFRHRFEPPMGLAHVENNNQEGQVQHDRHAPAAAPRAAQQPLLAEAAHLAQMHPDIQAVLRVAVDAAEAAEAQQEEQHPQGEEAVEDERLQQRRRDGHLFRFRFFHRQGGRQQPPL